MEFGMTWPLPLCSQSNSNPIYMELEFSQLLPVQLEQFWSLLYNNPDSSLMNPDSPLMNPDCQHINSGSPDCFLMQSGQSQTHA